MKKLIILILTLALCMSLAAPAFAYDYGFSTGEETIAGFGKATSTDEPVAPDPMNENERRNKDAALLPPPYFYGSGDIPTDPSSLYHDNLPSSGFVPGGQQYPATGGEDYAPGGGNVTMLPSTSQTHNAQTMPWYYADGSIGTLYIHKLDKTIKVYEGESLDNLKKGAGHFSSTSAWDGNAAFAGHNRGSWPYFSFVKNLKIGDLITYETLYGVRTYKVTSREQISETDYSKLGWSSDNLLTLITCVEDISELRWAAVCREV